MSATYPLNPGLSAQVTLDGSGNGQVSIGPQIPGVSWTITGVAVLVNNGVATNIPEFFLYNGAAQPGNFLSGSYTGNNDADSELNVILYPGQVLTGVWTGGDPGKTAVLSVTGTQAIGG